MTVSAASRLGFIYFNNFLESEEGGKPPVKPNSQIRRVAITVSRLVINIYIYMFINNKCFGFPIIRNMQPTYS